MKTLANYYACYHCVIGEKTFKNILIGPGTLPGLSRNGPRVLKIHTLSQTPYFRPKLLKNHTGLEPHLPSFIASEDNDLLFSERHRHTRKKEMRVLLIGVEPKTFRLLVRMLYH